MVREAVATGKTVEEAIESACNKLNVQRENVKIEVLELPSKRLLGLLGVSNAKVRAVLKITADRQAELYLSGILGHMGITDYAIEMHVEEAAIYMNVQGNDLGLMIGHRGETLDALQLLASLAANRGEESYKRIYLDAGDYRKKREKTLTTLAQRLAINAVKSKRTTTLEPMNSYERRVIHTAVQEIKGAASWSVGSEPSRRVVIGIGRHEKHAHQQ